MKKFTFTLLLIMLFVSLPKGFVFAQSITAQQFRVDGDGETFYPVAFTETNWFDGASEFEITRSDVHSDGTWRGALIAKFRVHTTRWGNGANFIEADIKSSRNTFIADWRDVTYGNSSSNIIVWLRGQSTYNFRSFNSTMGLPVVYLNGYQEINGPTLTSTTQVNPKITQNGLNYSGDISFAGSFKQGLNLGSELVWPLAQKNFTTAPREGVTPMSIRLWDNYNGGGPTSYGSLLEIYGRDSHMVSQLYFGGWDNSRIRYRQAFYADTKWSDWLFLLDNKNDVESSGNLKITGTGNHFISNGSLCVGTANTSNLEDVVLKLYRDVRPTFEMTDNYTKLQIGIAKNTWDGAPYSQPGDIIYRSTGPQHGLIFHMPDDNNDGLSYIRFGDNAHPNTVNITNKGFVGIGTFTPEFKLDVLGTIRAWGLKINNKKTADFVFAKDYKLPSLSEVETFVNKNNHLPGIASASEMEKNGVEIGEFQITLLQKIEELTLYSIQLKKDNETQAKANADLQQQLLDMKKELELIKKQMK